MTEITSELVAMQVQLTQRLARFRWKVRGYLLVEGLCKTLGVMLLLAIASFVLDRWLRLSVPTRMTLLVMALGFVGYLIWQWLIAPLRLPMDFVDLAAAAD